MGTNGDGQYIWQWWAAQTESGGSEVMVGGEDGVMGRVCVKVLCGQFIYRRLVFLSSKRRQTVSDMCDWPENVKPADPVG